MIIPLIGSDSYCSVVSGSKQSDFLTWSTLFGKVPFVVLNVPILLLHLCLSLLFAGKYHFFSSFSFYTFTLVTCTLVICTLVTCTLAICTLVTCTLVIRT